MKMIPNGIINQLTEFVRLARLNSYNAKFKAEKVANIKSSYDLIQRFISEPVATPLCSSQPEVVDVFDVDAFVGEWFQVIIFPN